MSKQWTRCHIEDAKCWGVTFVRDMSLAVEDKVSNE